MASCCELGFHLHPFCLRTHTSFSNANTQITSTHAQIDPGYLSSPVSVEFPTTGGVTAFMNYYPPANKDFKFPAGRLPALLVKIHGGGRVCVCACVFGGYTLYSVCVS